MSVTAMQTSQLNNTAQLGASVGVVSSQPLNGNGGSGGAMAPSTTSNVAGGGGAPKMMHTDSLSGLSASVAAMSMNPAGSSTSGGSGRRDPAAKGVVAGSNTVAATSTTSAGGAAAAAPNPNATSASQSGRTSAMATKRPEVKAPSSAAKDNNDSITQKMNELALANSGQRKQPNVSQVGSTAPPQSQIGNPQPSASAAAPQNNNLQQPSAGHNASTTNTPHNSVIQATSSMNSQSQNKAKKDKQSISYAAERVIGNGSFGVVYQATVIETGETVAIKKVLQDRRFKNRELQIMGMLDHPDVVALKHCFYSKGEKPDDVFLNLVMEYIPETIHRTLRNHTKAKKLVPIMYTKVYMYQVSRALAYIHSCGICHRDIKPQNLLLNTKSHDVKLCDFGSAKILIRGEPNVAYICSRYYRAPELVFEATEYTCAIDIWSLGCVMAELLLGKPLFPGDSGVDQLIEIIKILGTPTKEQIQAMNPNHQSFKFPQIKPHPWAKVFRNKAPPDAIDLVSKFLHYEPHLRLDPFEALAHPFFDELREPNARLPNGKPLPNLFNWTEVEFKRMEVVGLTKKLCPPHLIKPIRDKFKGVQLPTAPPVNPYASPYPHIIAQMAALAQQQAAQQAMGGSAAAGSGSAAAASPMPQSAASLLGPMVIPPFQGGANAAAAAPNPAAGSAAAGTQPTYAAPQAKSNA